MSTWHRRRWSRAQTVTTAVIATLSLGVLCTGASVAYVRSDAPPPAAVAPAPTTAPSAAPDPQRVVVSQPVAEPSARAAAPVSVAPLGRLFLPDALVRLPAQPTPQQLAALIAIDGVQGLTAVLTGDVEFAGRTVTAMAVDPGAFRAFTPQPTAKSDALWLAVARGEAAAAYALDKAGKLPLGERLAVGGLPNVRLGALAEFRLPHIDLVVNVAQGTKAGITTPTLLVSAPTATEQRLRDAVAEVVGGEAAVTMLRPAFVDARVGPVPGAPADLRTLYQQAALTCPGLPWQVLAAIGQVETNHGQNKAVSSAGAMGPMQFMPATWAVYGVDGDRDGKADILNQVDAVYSAARYLCATGGGSPETLRDAIWAYNHSEHYVNLVLSLAAKYR